MSLDFRVLPLSYYRHRYPMSHRRDGQLRFAAGAFFATLEQGTGAAADGQWLDVLDEARGTGKATSTVARHETVLP